MDSKARRYSFISSPLVLKPRPLHTFSQKTTSTSTTSSKSRQGPIYIPERFEVIVPSSPDSLPPASHLTSAPYEEVPPARVGRALNELMTAVGRVESRLSRVVSMREQQAGFISCQLRLLEELKDEHADLSSELEAKREELQGIEDQITRLQDRDVQGKPSAAFTYIRS